MQNILGILTLVVGMRRGVPVAVQHIVLEVKREQMKPKKSYLFLVAVKSAASIIRKNTNHLVNLFRYFTLTNTPTGIRGVNTESSN